MENLSGSVIEPRSPYIQPVDQSKLSANDKKLIIIVITIEVVVVIIFFVMLLVTIFNEPEDNITIDGVVSYSTSIEDKLTNDELNKIKKELG